MKKIHRLQKLPFKFLMTSLLIATTQEHVFAINNKQEIPENARTKSYGSGWECERGYLQDGEKCIVVKVPENAYLTNSAYGDIWKCNWSYRKHNETCTAIIIPANAYLNSYGKQWQCKRGYKSVDQTCIKVNVPENGYYVKSNYGSNWKCERGYKARKDACVALVVPVNAHLDYSGHSWVCNSPYVKQQNTCNLLNQSH